MAGSLNILGIPKPVFVLRGKSLERHSLIASGGAQTAHLVSARGTGAMGLQQPGEWDRGQEATPGFLVNSAHETKCKAGLDKGDNDFVPLLDVPGIRRGL